MSKRGRGCRMKRKDEDGFTLCNPHPTHMLVLEVWDAGEVYGGMDIKGGG
jgi:hypothetical protein